MTEKISLQQFRESDGVEDWRILSEGAYAYFHVGSFAEAIRFAEAIANLPGVATHQPDLDIRHGGVTVRLVTITKDYYGMARHDAELARDISAIARRLGYRADPSSLQDLLVVPGSLRTADVFPFWKAVLGYDPRPDSPDLDLVDPNRRGASFWFEQMDELRPDGGGAIHIAVFVPHEMAQSRVAAALAAGGRMVRDFGPAWWTLADSAGNEADIATTMGRD